MPIVIFFLETVANIMKQTQQVCEECEKAVCYSHTQISLKIESGRANTSEKTRHIGDVAGANFLTLEMAANTDIHIFALSTTVCTYCCRTAVVSNIRWVSNELIRLAW